MRKYTFPIVVERDKDGYFAFCPTLQGCYSQGASYEEALEKMRDAVGLHLEDRVAAGEAIPTSEMVGLTTLEVAV